jgi:ribosome recycling factor
MKTVISNTESKMEKSLDSVARDFAGVRAGRANPSVLDKVAVDYYGCPTPINQLASVSVAEARVLQIQPYDASVLKAIEKAILVSDIGINPQNDGRIIRLTFPPLTEERRKDLAKEIKKLAEEGKVAVRSIRRDAIEKLKALKKNNEITEDDQANGEKKIQTLTDKYCKEIDDLTAVKEKEIMEI